MAYAIGEIIYGIDLTNSRNLDVDQNELEEFKESEYVEYAYSGNGDTPYWMGVKKGGIDECSPELGESLIKKLTVTEEDQTKYKEMIERLRTDDEWSQHLRDTLIGEVPHVWLLWGSS